MPEGIQMSQRGETMETAISDMQDAYDALAEIAEAT
jgi:hypothetical protein